MTQEQIKSDKAVMPWWIDEILSCDGLAIWSVCEVTEEHTGIVSYEICEPEEAHCWLVLSRIKAYARRCLEDFATEQEARTFADKLLQTYPNLQENGLMY